MSLEIYCKGKGALCRHIPVSWFLSDEPIRFGRDPHFRQENYENCHELKIFKAEPDDEGTIKVKSSWDERKCFLQVISKFLILLLKGEGEIQILQYGPLPCNVTISFYF